MCKTIKKAMLTAVLTLLAASGLAQKTHQGHYLYSGERIAVPINSEVVLVYFHTAKMDTATIHRRYNCILISYT